MLVLAVLTGVISTKASRAPQSGGTAGGGSLEAEHAGRRGRCRHRRSPPRSPRPRALTAPGPHAEKHQVKMSKQKKTFKMMASIYLNKSSFFTSNVIHTTLI